jgi:hypothetical protein
LVDFVLFLLLLERLFLSFHDFIGERGLITGVLGVQRSFAQRDGDRGNIPADLFLVQPLNYRFIFVDNLSGLELRNLVETLHAAFHAFDDVHGRADRLSHGLENHLVNFLFLVFKGAHSISNIRPRRPLAGDTDFALLNVFRMLRGPLLLHSSVLVHCDSLYLPFSYYE